MPMSFPSVFDVAGTFIAYKPIMLREKGSNLYGSTEFFVAQVMSDFPIQLVQPTLFVCIFWWMSGLRDTASAFFQIWALAILFVTAMASFGYLLASIGDQIGIVFALGPMVILPFMLVSGFMISFDSLHPFWVWLKETSPFRYGFAGALTITFKDVSLGTPTQECIDGLSLSPCTGNEVLDYFVIDPTRHYLNFVILIAISVVVRLLAQTIFVLKTRRQKEV
eukprot:GHVO01004401.1.p1 GENE.GHVO01004401.1~~GHVO01004401.1.p1  ORF type:complete len:222 (+),score=33.33 GHVO01004401.1:87-752(+)